MTDLPHRISSAGLVALEAEGFFRSLDERELVAPGPDESRQRIARLCGSVPDALGNGCSPFSALRELLFAELNPMGAVDAVTISAPHSHWGPRAIIHRALRDGSGYEVGPLSAFPRCGWLRPASFLFMPEGLRTYEWCEEYPELEGAEWEEVTEALEVINGRVVANAPVASSCFAVSLNFRFKRLKGPNILPTLEQPNADDEKATTRVDSASIYGAFDAEAQVAWSLRRAPPADAAAKRVATILSRSLAELPPSIAQDVFYELRVLAERVT